MKKKYVTKTKNSLDEETIKKEQPMYCLRILKFKYKMILLRIKII